MKILKSGIAIIVFTLIIYSAWLMLKLTLPYFSFEYDVDFLLTKQAILYNDIWRWAFYIHISTSVFVLLFGLIQFVNPVRKHYPRLHNLLGKAYIFIILILSAPSGFVMALYANGGFWAKTSFVLTAVLWWIFTYVAYLKIRNKNVLEHINFMTRSYALTLSAISLRLFVVILPSFIHLHGRALYITVAWLSWLSTLIIAELLIKIKAIR